MIVAGPAHVHAAARRLRSAYAAHRTRTGRATTAAIARPKCAVANKCATVGYGLGNTL